MCRLSLRGGKASRTSPSSLRYSDACCTYICNDGVLGFEELDKEVGSPDGHLPHSTLFDGNSMESGHLSLEKVSLRGSSARCRKADALGGKTEKARKPLIQGHPNTGERNCLL